MWALIQNGSISEITDIDPAGRFHPSLVWVQCNDKVQSGWAYDGEEFAPPGPVESELYVPQQVTNAQCAAALIHAGLWGDVLAYIDAMSDPTEKALAEVALHRTTHWSRTSPFLNGTATALGLSSEDLDNLFIQASEIDL